MSWCSDNHRARSGFVAASGVQVSEGATPSGHAGYAWVVRHEHGATGFCAEWAPDEQRWVLWSNPGDQNWTAHCPNWPAPGVGGAREVVRLRAGGDPQ